MSEDDILSRRAALDAAVEEAYRVFARYRLAGGVLVCRCNVCVAPEVERQLVATPLRRLDRATLAEYTDSAHGVEEPRIAEDFRYFLPRYFELIAEGEYPTHILEENTLIRLYGLGYRRNWPEKEVAAVDAFFAALVRWVLVSPIACTPPGRTGLIYCEGPDIGLTLDLIATAGADLASYLALWAEEPARAATIRLADLASHINVLGKDEERGSHELAEAGHAALRRFLGQETIRRRVEAACLAEEDPLAASVLSLGEQSIAGLMGVVARGEM